MEYLIQFKIKINKSNIFLKLEDNSKCYYWMIKLKQNKLWMLKNNMLISGVISDSKFYTINELIILDINDLSDEIEMELIWWRLTDNVVKFIQNIKSEINKELMNFN